MEDKLKGYTSNQLKGIIETQLPDKKGYSKLKKSLLIAIIIDNDLKIINDESLDKNKQIPQFSIRHGIFSPFHPDKSQRYIYTDGR